MLYFFPGQIIEVQVSSTENKALEFVVGQNCCLFPYINPAYLKFDTPPDPKKLPIKSPDLLQKPSVEVDRKPEDKRYPPSTLEQILRGNLDVQIKEGGVIEFIKNTDTTKADPASNTTVKSEPSAYTDCDFVELTSQKSSGYPLTSSEIPQFKGGQPLTQPKTVDCETQVDIYPVDDSKIETSGTYTNNIIIEGFEGDFLAKDSQILPSIPEHQKNKGLVLVQRAPQV